MSRAALSLFAAVAALAGASTVALSHGGGDAAARTDLVLNRPTVPVDATAGLAAWQRIYAVVSSPRCANCHTDESNVPMWSGSYFGSARPHGMNIDAGPSRIGVETIPCSTCHVTSTAPNKTPHAPPHAGLPWMLAPVEFAWFGKKNHEICAQMRDPERNGGRDGGALVEHIVHDAQTKAFITWGFNPGGGREPAPGTMQAHLDDMVLWTAAGMPCPPAP